ncbi:hypothetical protein FYR84_09090 [Salmonella enterica]|nr:hypothetical protein [Salmonella enterica]
MAKKVSKFFRIGVEGDTCDGRIISASDIQEMAETYDPRVYRAYQPVTAPAGRTYIDQSSPTYQITLPGGGAPGGQLGNQLQDALEKYERDKRAKARASMMHD